MDTENKKINKKRIVIIGVIALLITSVIIIVILFISHQNQNRSSILTNIEKDSEIKFELNGQKYYLGSKLSELQDENLSYDHNYVNSDDYILSDNIATQNFQYNGKNVFLGALYCGNEEKCSYNETILIKANFYENSEVIIDGFLKKGITYEKIREEYGKEDGEFYQDENSKIWLLGEEEIGTPYYIITFDKYEKVKNIKIGILWYENEADYIID